MRVGAFDGWVRLGFLALAFAGGLLSGCTDRAAFTIGDECIRNSDCDLGLVCRVGRCRTECLDDVDCGIGLACYFQADLGPEATGGCQLDDEHDCDLNSDCPDDLVCRFGNCTFECTSDADCGPDRACVEHGGGFACVWSNDVCLYNTDCPEPLICGPEQICRLECREDRDCITPRTCDPTTFRCVL